MHPNEGLSLVFTQLLEVLAGDTGHGRGELQERLRALDDMRESPLGLRAWRVAKAPGDVPSLSVECRQCADGGADTVEDEQRAFICLGVARNRRTSDTHGPASRHAPVAST